MSLTFLMPSRGTVASVLLAVSLVTSGCSEIDTVRDIGAPAVLHPLQGADFRLSGVISITRTASGAIVVGDRGLPGLHVLRENAPAVQLGRGGSGPGEFEALTRVHECRDGTVIAYDFSQARLHLFDEHRFQRQIQLPPSLVTGDFVGCTTSDSIIFSRLPDQVPGLGLHVVPITLFTFSPTSGNLAWLATLRGSEMYFSERFQVFYERPYGLQTLISFTPQGVVFAENSRIQLFRLLGDGSSTPVFLRPHTSESVSESFRARYIRDRVAEEPDSSARVVLRSVLDDVPWAKSVPPIDRLIASTTGELWVRRTPRGEESAAEWLVVDGPTDVKQTIWLPRNVRVMFIDALQILAVEDLPSGEERLVRIDRVLQ